MLQFLIVMIASNHPLQRKLDYVEEERRVLREQLDAATGSKKLADGTRTSGRVVCRSRLGGMLNYHREAA